jgi:biopolymer transport protein ExbD
MAGPNDSGNQTLTAINVTPLVDVMLVLLVIFMITAKLDDQHGLPLDLPAAASGSDAQQMLTVVLDATGARSIDGVPIRDDAALRTLAQGLHGQYPELRTVIAASTRTNHGDVIHLLDTLRLAGIDKVAFAVEPSP